jgi:gamma-glutamyl hercynylcysteine S-oxide synthase
MAQDARVFSMVIEHELMHQETLLYMLQELAHARKIRPAWLPPPVLGRGRSPASVPVGSGTATLGVDLRDVAFAWDNESPRVQVSVPSFRIDAAPVTNGEFLAFVEDGGYRRRALWAPEDWGWSREAERAHPAAWASQNGTWLHRRLFDVLPLEQVMDWPVYVSLAEARAFARWRGLRLPTEAEFHRAAYGDPAGGERAFPWGAASPGRDHGNFDFRCWGPTPVGAFPEGASAWGVHDLVGNGWEWTDTPFTGFPGFEPWITGYRGYSADFFDGKHFVLKGGSWATATELLRRSFRNWFQAHYPYVFAKFRCVTRG